MVPHEMTVPADNYQRGRDNQSILPDPADVYVRHLPCRPRQETILGEQECRAWSHNHHRHATILQDWGQNRPALIRLAGRT